MVFLNTTTKWAIGGKGGEGGYPGAGGKILQSTLDVTPGQKISFTCGVGGLGAAFDASNRANTPQADLAGDPETTPRDEYDELDDGLSYE